MASLLPRDFVDTGAAIAVVQFNTLAQSLANNFVGVPERALEWEHRAPLLGAEIRRALGPFSTAQGPSMPVTPAVVCLQEVDEECCGVLREAAGLESYEMIFAKKHSVDDGNAHSDGLLVLYDPVLSLQKRETLRYKYVDGKPQSQVALLLRFERFVLATTHLKSGPGEKNAERRANQARQLVEALQRFEPTLDDTYVGGTLFKSPPVILAGDLNDTPGAPLFEVLMTQFGLENAYDASNTPLSFTTWKRRADGVKKCIEDYILVSDARVTSILAPPNEADVEAGGLLPSLVHASDHVLLAARLAF